MELAKVIKYNGDNNTLIWKFDCEDINIFSQLIVGESQEAILFKNGQAYDSFGPGRHTIISANIPLLKRVIGSVFGGGGVTPFPCEVYYVNKVNVLDFLWGTDSPIEIDDPVYHLYIRVRANGQTGIRIVDARKFLVKVSGLLTEYSVDTLKKAIKGMMMASIKECIHTTILEKQVSILEITTKLSEISDAILAKINARIADLGIQADHFVVSGISSTDEDIAELKKVKAEMYRGFSEADLEAYKVTKASQARAAARQMEGYTYQEERRFDVLEEAAKNESSAGGMIGMGVGVGVGVGVSREVSNMTAGMISNPAPSAPSEVPSANSKFCTTCGASIPKEANFCSNCGAKQAPMEKICPTCGKTCAPESRFCSVCGQKLD